MNSISIMRSDKGWSVVMIKEGSETPEIRHFADFNQVKEYIATLSA